MNNARRPIDLPEEAALLLRSVRVERLDTPEERQRARQLLDVHNYLGGVRAVGEQLHYALCDA